MPCKKRKDEKSQEKPFPLVVTISFGEGCSNNPKAVFTKECENRFMR
jgi:hypothetical protein